MNLSEEVRLTIIAWTDLLGVKAEQVIHIELQLIQHYI